MPNDAFTIRAAVNELAENIIGAKINKIIQTDRDCFILYLYRQGRSMRLLICGGANDARIHLTEHDRAALPSPSGFCMTLRKYFAGGIITGIQTLPYERIVKITAESKTELFDTAGRTIYVEIFGRHSNIFICDTDDTIIAPLKLYGMDMQSKRILLSRTPYLPPENLDKAQLSDKDGTERVLRAFSGGDLGEYLAANIAGLSKVSAAHITLSFAPSQILSGGLSSSMLAAAMEKLAEFDGRFNNINALEPCISVSEKSGAYRDFFAFKYIGTGKVTGNFNSLNSCMDEYFYNRSRMQSLHALRQSAQSKLSAAIKKSNKKIATLSARLEECANAKIYKKYGELITSYIYLVPEKVSSVTVTDYYSAAGEDITIPLKVELSPSKNAQRYYKLYRKLTSGALLTGQQLDKALAELQYLQSVESFLAAADDEDTLKQIIQELSEAASQRPQNIAQTAGGKNGKNSKSGKYNKNGKNSGKSGKSAQNMPQADKVQIDGFTVYTGKNNIQNDHITFRIAKQDDIWLHVKDYHGSHVVISAGGADVPQDVIYAAAKIAAKHSQAAAAGSALVDYCLKKYVKKAPGAAPGQVYYSNQTTLSVSID